MGGFSFVRSRALAYISVSVVYFVLKTQFQTAHIIDINLTNNKRFECRGLFNLFLTENVDISAQNIQQNKCTVAHSNMNTLAIMMLLVHTASCCYNPLQCTILGFGHGIMMSGVHIMIVKKMSRTVSEDEGRLALRGRDTLCSESFTSLTTFDFKHPK